VFAALIMSIFACLLIYYNMKLLGEFFFCIVVAAITGLWLRKVKVSIVETLQMACLTQFYFVKQTFWYRLFALYLIPMIEKRNPCEIVYQLRF